MFQDKQSIYDKQLETNANFAMHFCLFRIGYEDCPAKKGQFRDF